MNFICQKNALKELDMLRLTDRHSVLVEGPSGCGKTYLAMQYAKMLNISDFQVIAPKVDAIKSAIDNCLEFNESVVLCIENLDTGVPGASYALLKFLEEPLPNTYIVVTCRNLKRVPDTIVSRSAVVVTSPPVDSDLTTFAMNSKQEQFSKIKMSKLWKCVSTFQDVDTVLSMNSAQLTYFSNLSVLATFRDTVSNIVWNLGHYPDNSETPVELVIRYIMKCVNTPYMYKIGIECLNDLALKRVATHAVLAKFAFQAKYCE